MHIVCGRSPLGERGLKSTAAENAINEFKSLSAWRAWIEIKLPTFVLFLTNSRSPLGERGLK